MGLEKLVAGVSTRANLISYFNTNADLIDAYLAKSNWGAGAVDPDADNDDTEGYATGSFWFTDTGIWQCVDASTGSAVWRQTYPAEADIAATIHAATSKETPADADELGLVDSAASYYLKKLTWANLKTALNTIYALSGHNHTGVYLPSATKLDDLGAPDDNTDLNVSTSKHGLFPKLPNTAQRFRGDGNWVTPAFSAMFVFGDGSAVLSGQQVNNKIPIASKIVAAEVTSRDATGDLLSGSVTCTIYIHDYNANADSVSASDTFALASASSMRETGLDIAVAAGKRITCVISGITTCKQVDLTLDLEAT
jgi:hypothetical protein